MVNLPDLTRCVIRIIPRKMRQILRQITMRQIMDRNRIPLPQEYQGIMVRRAEKCDLCEVAELYESAFHQCPPKEDIEILHSDYPDAFLVGEKDDRIVGFIFSKIELSLRRWRIITRAWFYALAVAHDYRRLGLGEKLLRLELGAVSAYGVSEVYFFVAPNALPALHLYKKVGFICEGMEGDSLKYSMGMDSKRD